MPFGPSLNKVRRFRNNVDLRTLFPLLLLGATCFAIPVMCFDRASPPEVVQGQRALFQVMGEDNLKKTDFFDLHPDGHPSDFVEFYATDAADPLRPKTTDFVWSDDTGDVRVVDTDTDQLMIPEGVDLVALEVDPDRGQQLVYIPDDDEGRMRIECYDDPDDRPTAVLDWEFPTRGDEFSFDKE